MKGSTNLSFLLLFSINLVLAVYGQLQTGFISIDCGAIENFNYVDMDTGISYTSDGPYISTGVNKNISLEYAYPINPMLPQPLSDLRSFPQGNKNCYALTPTNGNGSLNLIRATFMYGNYDGENKLPEFDLYLDVSFWFSVKFINNSDVVTTEIISVALSDTVYVCLVNTGLGVPFISGLELRPLNSSIYNTDQKTSGSLVLFKRLNFGTSNGTGRYTDDAYDRIWSLESLPFSESIDTALEIDNSGNGYKLPVAVINSAAKSVNSSKSLELYWTTIVPNAQFYTYMYFTELVKLTKNQSRQFNISWNGETLFGPFSPRYLFASVLSNPKALVGKEHRISIRNTGNSSLAPMINAMEIYMFRELDMLPTYGGDVEAITNVKTTYEIKRNWIGDPCGPKNHSWNGLICHYNESSPPRITSLNLSSSHLNGVVANSIAKLSSLESLDLSNNSLSGQVPEFLNDLRSLKFLNLKGNNLSGLVPSALVERSKKGTLALSVDDHNYCNSGSCKKKKNIVVPLVASLSSTLVLLIILIFIWRFRSRKQTETVADEEDSLSRKKQRFTYPQVISITNNFEKVIGKGGFGSVYYGTMEDGTPVAVKILSPTSKQGSKEFRTEAELLMRVHHRSLVSFVGYCHDGNHMALISEYMGNGNLKDYVQGRSFCFLSWEKRLRIAIDAGKGLEYLHLGCKPPIIHRDVKTANILLGENLDAKIADFGLSRAFSPTEFSPTDGLYHADTGVIGTRGYLDPEYYTSQKINEKSDVYSFGIVLLELITGLPAIMKGNHQTHILEWVSPLLEKGEITSIVDQRLQDDFDLNSVWKVLELAMVCTLPTSIQRPTMCAVLPELKECLAMELSNRRERNPMVPRDELFISSNNTTDTFSMENDSMTGPFAR